MGTEFLGKSGRGFFCLFVFIFCFLGFFFYGHEKVKVGEIGKIVRVRKGFGVSSGYVRLYRQLSIFRS